MVVMPSVVSVHHRRRRILRVDGLRRGKCGCQRLERVWPKVRPKGRTNIRDGGLDSPAGEYSFPCFAVFISSAAACKRGQEVCTLFCTISFKELILDSICFQESSPSFKAPSLLLVGCWDNSCVLVNEGGSECSHEIIPGGRVEILKFGGVCSCSRESNMWMM